MILPIYAYGHPVLKQVGKEITPEYPELAALIENMWDTMYNANGVGLAAPQVGLAIRIFLADSEQLKPETRNNKPGIKKVFINAQILEQWGAQWAYEEGCLSIPDINGEVERPAVLKIKYFDEQFVEHIEEYDGINARVIQHEYDHIQGVLFTDYLSPLKKRLLKGKLTNITKGIVDVSYRMKFSGKK